MPDIQPAGALPPHWQRILDIVTGDLPPIANDGTALVAAKTIGSPVAVLLTLNEDRSAFDARIFGDHPGWRRFASLMCDYALKGLSEFDQGPTHRHVARGTDYRVTSTGGEVQTSRPIVEGDTLTTYVDAGGKVWHRLDSEFNDGRFVAIGGSNA